MSDWSIRKLGAARKAPLIVMSLVLALVLVSCGSSTRTVTTQQTAVEHDAGGGYVAVPLNTSEALAVGHRVRTDGTGEGLLKLACAWLLMYSSSGVQFQQLDANGANIGLPYGAASVSTICPELNVIAGVPAEAEIGSTSTLFLVAYDRNLRQTLLWTQVGTATLANLKGGRPDQKVTVPAGYWSVVRQGQPPEPPQPVSKIGPILDQMGLRGVYNRTVARLEGSGFGPGAPSAIKIQKIEQ